MPEITTSYEAQRILIIGSIVLYCVLIMPLVGTLMDYIRTTCTAENVAFKLNLDKSLSCGLFFSLILLCLVMLFRFIQALIFVAGV